VKQGKKKTLFSEAEMVFHWSDQNRRMPGKSSSGGLQAAPRAQFLGRQEAGKQIGVKGFQCVRIQTTRGHSVLWQIWLQCGLNCRAGKLLWLASHQRFPSGCKFFFFLRHCCCQIRFGADFQTCARPKHAPVENTHFFQFNRGGLRGICKKIVKFFFF
jgi:hypothetical protein